MPGLYRKRGRLFVALSENGVIVLPVRDELDADEVLWLDGVALPELRSEWWATQQLMREFRPTPALQLEVGRAWWLHRRPKRNLPVPTYLRGRSR